MLFREQSFVLIYRDSICPAKGVAGPLSMILLVILSRFYFHAIPVVGVNINHRPIVSTTICSSFLGMFMIKTPPPRTDGLKVSLAPPVVDVEFPSPLARRHSLPSTHAWVRKTTHPVVVGVVPVPP